MDILESHAGNNVYDVLPGGIVVKETPWEEFGPSHREINWCDKDDRYANVISVGLQLATIFLDFLAAVELWQQGGRFHPTWCSPLSALVGPYEVFV